MSSSVGSAAANGNDVESPLIVESNSNSTGDMSSVHRPRSEGDAVVPNSSLTDSGVLEDAREKKLQAVDDSSICTSTHTLREPDSAKNDYPVCSKHGNQRMQSISASPGKPALCDNCSKSMLSYISLFQQFLDGIAKDISKQVDPLSRCVECVKESLQFPTPKERSRSVTNSGESNTDVKTQKKRKSSLNMTKQKQEATTQPITDHGSRTFDQSSSQRFLDTKSKVDYVSQRTELPSVPVPLQQRKEVFDPPRTSHQPSLEGQAERTVSSEQRMEQRVQQRLEIGATSNINLALNALGNSKTEKSEYQAIVDDNNNDNQQTTLFHNNGNESQTVSDLQTQAFSTSDVRLAMESTNVPSIDEIPSRMIFQGQSPTQFPYGDGVDGILSTIYRVERGLSDLAKSPTLWERVAELQGQKEQQDSPRVANEAFVTIARNNADVLGCLVLAASLLLCATKKTLCVLVFDGVSPAFKAHLSSVFHVVQHIRSLDSVGTTKLSLLDQPELGISFVKLNVWRLEQFTKCVFFNNDTMVIQNCDELFYHDELSAVPDIGWPDCFNSAVFVFKPSVQTFWNLLQFAENQGSYDGGDQGLLNTYFSSWSQDIHKKLSFIYNLMANVSYTYTPAFKQFGRNVKIVQFMGSYKPWHVKFYSGSGQIAPSSAVHPTYIQFVHVWVNVFRVSILPLFSHEIQKYASSQNVISAHQLLQFFPSPAESDVEFLLTPPSIRLRPSETSLNTPKSAAVEKLLLPQSTTDKPAAANVKPKGPAATQKEVILERVQGERQNDRANGNALPEVMKVFSTPNDETGSPAIGDTDTGIEPDTEVSESGEIIPGSAVGNYQGMSAWEQGRMDYEGNASSDTIIKRLHFLMEKPDRLV